MNSYWIMCECLFDVRYKNAIVSWIELPAMSLLTCKDTATAVCYVRRPRTPVAHSNCPTDEGVKDLRKVQTHKIKA